MTTINNLQFTIYKKGFTLIELLIVIAIIGILSSFLLANYNGVRQRTRDGVRKTDLRQIQSALELYRSDQAKYPTSLYTACNSSLMNPPTNTVTYMQKIPCDPSTSTRYQYATVSPYSKYCLRACLENINDGDRDYIRYGVENPPNTTTGCTGTALTACTSGKSYTLQNP